jgi:hypothetical protein
MLNYGACCDVLYHMENSEVYNVVSALVQIHTDARTHTLKYTIFTFYFPLLTVLVACVYPIIFFLAVSNGEMVVKQRSSRRSSRAHA